MVNVTVNEFLDTLYPADAAGEVCIARRMENRFRHYNRARGDVLTGETYVSVSTVLPAEKLRRRKEDCVTACVVMLDDVGTKVEVPPVAPTVILETSPGNFQYVYRIEPLLLEEHGHHYEACLERLAAKKFTDGGALGINRVFRLPGSVNVKREEPWATRVTEWAPTRVWTLGALMEAFDVDASAPPVRVEPSAETHYLPAEADPVLIWLGSLGLTGALRDGWHVVTCPWHAEHSNEDKTAAYSPLGAGSKPYLRGFKCLHEHCASRTITHFLAWAGSQGGPGVPAVAPTEDLGRLLALAGTNDLTIDERYRLIREPFTSVSAAGLPDAKMTRGGLPQAQQIATSDNVEYILRECGVQCRFNMQSRESEFSLSDEALQDLVPNEHSIARGVTDACLRLGIANTKIVETVMVERALNNRYHPMQAWVESKPWDGASRLGVLAGTVTVGGDEGGLWNLFLRKWLIQGIQAVYGWNDPKQIGSVLVFSGEQYKGKTRWFQSLVPHGLFTASARLALSWNYKDSVMAVTKTPITELGELDSTFKKSDTGALKAFLTSEHDVYRQPFAAITLRIPRTTIFCATVNRVDFLMDETGSRRFWPVEVSACDPDHSVDMQQVWAEALTLWRGGEQWWLTDEEHQKQSSHTDYYRVTSEVEETFTQYVDRTATQTKEEYVAMNLSTLLDRLNIYHTPPNMGTMRTLVEKKFGRRRARISGVQNAWYMPDPMRITVGGGS